VIISLAWTTFCEPLQTLRPLSTAKTGPVTRKLVVSKQADFAVVFMKKGSDPQLNGLHGKNEKVSFLI